MKCLNLYAVFGSTGVAGHHHPTKYRGALEHYPVFADDQGVQHVHFNGDYIPLADMIAHRKHLIRMEPGNLGN